MLRGIASLALSGMYYPTIQTATPTTGQTVVAADDSRNRVLWLSPAGTLATLTITIPSEAQSKVGQMLFIGSSQQVTSLTVNGATTIFNAPSDLQVGDLTVLVKVSANTWAKLQE